MGKARVRSASKQTAPQRNSEVESRVVRLDKRKALRMGFIPFQPDLFGEKPATTDWTRELKRPRCQEYWNPAKPGRIRRVYLSIPTGPNATPTVTLYSPDPQLAAGARRAEKSGRPPSLP